jgi:hypothetical protein
MQFGPVVFQMNNSGNLTPPLTLETLRAAYSTTAPGDWTIGLAYLCIIFIAARDGSNMDIRKEKAAHIKALAKRSPLFRHFDGHHMASLEVMVQQRIATRGATVLHEACMTLPHGLVRLSAFANALDLILFDGVLSSSQDTMIKDLIKLLELEQGVADEILKVLMIKNKY